MTKRDHAFFIRTGKEAGRKISPQPCLLLSSTITANRFYLVYQLIFLEKYISIPTMTNNPTLPMSSEKSC
jgi:hypothetical protein